MIVPSTRCICVIEGHPFGCIGRWCNSECTACVEFYVLDPGRMHLVELGTAPDDDEPIPDAVMQRIGAAGRLLRSFVRSGTLL